MSNMKKRIFVLIQLILLGININIACECGKIPPLPSYEYIALVEIKNIEAYDVDSHQIEIATIRQFEGELETRIIISGGNSYLGWTSSCDFEEKKGEEWLIFGRKSDSGIITGYCTPSTLYKTKEKEITGWTNMHLNRGLIVMEQLERFFGCE